MKSTYEEPTIMWRLRHSEDRSGAHAVIIPRGSSASALWFSQGQPQECREFSCWRHAMHWLDGELLRLLLSGWELEEPLDD